MHTQANLASTAFLIANPTRAAMLMALCDGGALPAGELAHVAGITAQTASTHLAKLLDGGLLTCESQGRHRYYRLANTHVAHALEHLAAISSDIAPRHRPLNREAQGLRFARCCYDHLAGQLGVTVTQALLARGYIAVEAEKQFAVSAAGAAWFATLALDVATLKPTRYGLARQCLDWTERTHHLAGPLGVQLLTALCTLGWLRRCKTSRAIQVTPIGWQGLKQQLGIEPFTATPRA
jgi:DNA-binding transcriptional ArsR family regulator